MNGQDIKITVDAVIFYKENESVLKVLLIQRKNDPYKGQWALPGGFLENDENLEQGAIRELEEETGLKVPHLEQVGVFADPDRDPRGRIISIAFTAKISKESKVKGNDDAVEAKWFNINELPEVAFDHYKIIKKAAAQPEK